MLQVIVADPLTLTVAEASEMVDCPECEGWGAWKNPATHETFSCWFCEGAGSVTRYQFEEWAAEHPSGRFGKGR